MPALRTEITEIVTALGMLGFPDVARALLVRPATLVNVGPAEYDRLEAARAVGRHEREFTTAWDNGVAFARSAEGLRGRPPWWLEWKGSHRPPGYEQIPADLRIDHVYLISCKYGSNILVNSSPANVFDRRLADRRDTGEDWYLETAPVEYQDFYAECRRHLGAGDLPDSVAELGPEARARIKRGIPRTLSGDPALAYRALAGAVSSASVVRWKRALDRPRQREEMLWRLLRLQAAPYFVLGESAARHPIRYRVATPWDFRARYRFAGFEAVPELERAQPVVSWRAAVHDRRDGGVVEVAGHVEIRWSHGRFASAPEAKVYLDTPHHDVPGYFPLGADDGTAPELTLGW